MQKSFYMLLLTAASIVLLGCDKTRPRIATPAQSAGQPSEAQEHPEFRIDDRLKGVERRYAEIDIECLFAYIKPATRVEVTITEGGAGRTWRRIGPFVIDSDPELTGLKKRVLDYVGITKNPAPFAVYDRPMEFEITWVVTDPPERGIATIHGYHRGRHCVFQRSEELLIYYSDESVFDYLLKCAKERADREEAFLFEVPE